MGHNAPVTASVLDELLAIVRRDLGAADARVIAAHEEPPAAAASVVCELPDGRRLVAAFTEPPADLEARRRRLELIASSFETVLTHDRASRPPPARSLHEELAALAARSGAVDAVVIDAHSPVIWAAAGGLEETPANDQDDEEGPPPRPRDPLSARALAAVRALPEMETLHKGGHLHHTVSGEDFGYIARSFAAIYVLVLAFPGPFDELRAHRAVVLALPHIEGLVLALPPLDPAPTRGAVVALRPRRRR
jgi:hypothetical protein